MNVAFNSNIACAMAQDFNRDILMQVAEACGKRAKWLEANDNPLAQEDAQIYKSAFEALSIIAANAS